MSREKPRYCEGVLGMCAHSPRQGAQTAEHKPAIKWGGHSAAFALNISDSAKEFALLPPDHNAPENVAMAADIFCGRVQNDINAKVEWPLQSGRPGIVTNADGASGMSAFRNLCNTHNL